MCGIGVEHDAGARHRAGCEAHRAAHARPRQFGAHGDRGVMVGDEERARGARAGHQAGKSTCVDPGPQGATEFGVERQCRGLQVVTEQRCEFVRVAGRERRQYVVGVPDARRIAARAQAVELAEDHRRGQAALGERQDPVECSPREHRHELFAAPGALDRVVSSPFGAQPTLAGVMLFGIPETKDAKGSAALDPDGILTAAIRAVRGEFDLPLRDFPE